MAKKRIINVSEDNLSSSILGSVFPLMERLAECILALKKYGEISPPNPCLPSLEFTISIREFFREIENFNGDNVDDFIEEHRKKIEEHIDNLDIWFTAYHKMIFDYVSNIKTVKIQELKSQLEKDPTTQDLYKLFDDMLVETVKNILNAKIQDQNILVTCYECCGVVLLYAFFAKKMTDNDNNYFEDEIGYMERKSYEALGYWTAKLEQIKNAMKSKETIQQQKEKKEEYVTQTFLKLINNPTERKVLDKLSQNKIADRIRDIAVNDLKNVKTKTGVLVLTRKPYTDKDGKPNFKYRGLERDTVIDIMKKTNKFQFNPFKNKTS